MTQITNHFNVSDRYGVFLPGCSFLGNPTEDGLEGGYIVESEEDTGEQVTMFCSFKVETSRLPYRMGGRFKCEEPLLEASEDPSIAFGTTGLGGGALSLNGGMADVLHGSECEEPNCLLCVKHYRQCLSESLEAYPRVQRGGSGSGDGGGGVAPTALAALSSGALLSSSLKQSIDATAHWAAGLGFQSTDGGGTTDEVAIPQAALTPPPPPPRNQIDIDRLRSLCIGALIALITCILPTPSTTSLLGRITCRRPSQAEQDAAHLIATYCMLSSHTLLAYLHFTSPSVQFGRLLFGLIPFLGPSPHVRLGYYTGSSYLGLSLLITFGILSLFFKRSAGLPSSLIHTLLILTFTSLLSTPTPIAYPLAALLVTIRYAIDKCLLRYSTPSSPQQQHALMAAFIDLLPPILLLKCASLYVFNAGTRAGYLGASVAVISLMLWLLVRSPHYAASLGDLLTWADPYGEHAISQARINLVKGLTHQSLRLKNQVLPYPPTIGYRWANPLLLKLLVRCPTSHELIHVLPTDSYATSDESQQASVAEAVAAEASEPDAISKKPSPPPKQERQYQHGSAVWSRMHYLIGGEAYETFNTWNEARSWIESNLREPLVSADGHVPHPAGVSADDLPPSAHAAAAEAAKAGGLGGASAKPLPLREQLQGRFNYSGMPTQLIAPKDGHGKWVVVYTRERSNALPSLKWRIIEAGSHEEMATGLEKALHLYGHGVWTLQTVCAERLLPEEGSGAGGVRWVAVLRSGASEISTEWTPEDTGDGNGRALAVELVQERMSCGMELDMIAGLSGDDGHDGSSDSSLLMTFLERPFSSWASRDCSFMTSDFPHHWLSDQLHNKNMLITSIHYCGGCWSILLSQNDEQGEHLIPSQALMFEPCWPPPSQSSAKMRSYLDAGYRLTSLCCGPSLPYLTTHAPEAVVGVEGPTSTYNVTYIAVLTKCNHAMAPREARPRGSLTYPHRMVHLLHGRSFHVDYTKGGGCTVHATSTAAAAPNGLEITATPPTTYLRAASIIDGDESTYWRSDELEVPKHQGELFLWTHSNLAPNDLEVTVTIDLGPLEVWVDRVLLFFGGKSYPFPFPDGIERIPADAEILLAPSNAVTFQTGLRAGGGGANPTVRRLHAEPGMRDGRYVVDEKHDGVKRFPIGGGAEPAAGSAGSLEAALRGAASRAAARRKAGGYVLGESCCVIDLGEVAHSTRFVQIRLKRPAEGATSFALRNVYVLGPRAADAEGARSAERRGGRSRNGEFSVGERDGEWPPASAAAARTSRPLLDVLCDRAAQGAQPAVGGARREPWH